MKAVLFGVMMLACVVPAAWAGDAPRPDIDAAVGTFQDGDILYVLVYTFGTDGRVVGGVYHPPTEDHIAAWNVTDGMTLVEPHSFTLADGDWGPVPGGYKDIILDGAPRTVVAVVDGPPEIIETVDAVPYTAENTRESGSYVLAKGDGERLIVLQIWFANNAVTHSIVHHFYGVDEPPIEVTGQTITVSGEKDTMIIINIDGQNYAAVNTVEGPPVLVDALEAATLGLGDITDLVPADYLRWNAPPRLLSVAVDASAVVDVFQDGDRVYAAVSGDDGATIHDITNPLEPEILIGNATEAAELIPQITECLGCEMLATGEGVVHVTMTNPERANLSVPEWFVLGEAAGRVAPEGTWAVVATADGGIILAETDPNTEVAVVRDGPNVWAVERDAGWETVFERSNHGGSYSDIVTFGDPGIRAYDMADPASPEKVGQDVLPSNYDGFGEAGRAITAEIGGETWVLVPARAEIPDGPIMVVSGLGSFKGGHSSHTIELFFTVRNTHHEPLTIFIDRLSIGGLMLEQYHSYSDFEASTHGDIRLRGPTAFGKVGPTDAYGPTAFNKIYTIYAFSETNIAYALVDTRPNFIYLEPGDHRTVRVYISDPCETENRAIYGCGPAKNNFDPKQASGSKHVVLVAEGYPAWTASSTR